MSSTLSSRALILSLNISQWSGFRHDSEVTEEAIKDNKAKADAGRFNKRLLDKESLAGITKVVGATRSGFVQKTAPWLNDGSRIMNASGYLDFSAWFRDQRSDFDAEVTKFIAIYDQKVAESQARLGDMFKPADYPSASELRNKFSMKMNVLPVPDKDDFRVDMSEEQAAAIRADIEQSVKNATDAAIKDAFQRVSEVAERMVDRMTAYRPGRPGVKAEGTFTATLTQNALDLAALLPSLNIAADPRLDAMIANLQEMAAEDVTVLRVNKSARDHAATKAQEILDTIGTYFG